MTDTNPFGGGNPNSLYVPMSEIEQEVIARLVESGSLYVNVVGWGYVQRPAITHGDLRLQIQLPLTFDRPEPPGVPVRHFDLELRMLDGTLLYRSREIVEYGGKPLMVAAGLSFQFVWEIAVGAIDPALVKRVKPAAVGYTSRLQDRDTKEISHGVGNMRLDTQGKNLLRIIREGEDRSRADDAAKRAKVEAKTKTKGGGGER